MSNYYRQQNKNYQCEVGGCYHFAEGFCTNCGFRMCPNDHGWKVESEEDGCPKCPVDNWNTIWYNTEGRHHLWYEGDDE